MSDLDLAEDLRAAMGEFVRRARRHDTVRPGQAAVLGHLDRTGPLSIAELARVEQVKHQSMTRTVNLLVDQGLVTTAPDEKDRRQQVVTITDTGRRLLAEERHRRSSAISRAIAGLDAQDQEIVRRIPDILRKLEP